MSRDLLLHVLHFTNKKAESHQKGETCHTAIYGKAAVELTALISSHATLLMAITITTLFATFTEGFLRVGLCTKRAHLLSLLLTTS